MNTRGFTLVELAAVMTVGAGAVGFGAAALHGPRDTARQIKDATQERNMLQACVIFAQGNKDVYPLPSLLDVNNMTVKDQGRAKDTTANIFSILIYNASISPELVYSPVENNAKIKIHKSYELTNPKTAVRPADALWDPAFSADFTSEKGGNFSYAHLQPSASKSGKAGQAGRLKRWSNTFNGDEALISNRGPEITSVEYAKRSARQARPTRTTPRRRRSPTTRATRSRSSRACRRKKARGGAATSRGTTAMSTSSSATCRRASR
ncbi:MAG: prepilin-type N-terminal cleavage/methylation domain-containing protein [Phycisphaerales bacterium]